MFKLNENYLKLPNSYLFSTVAKKVAAHKEAHPEAKIIRLGIGDVTRPIPAACIDALHKAVDEMGTVEGFRGYGPEQGYDFLREAIVAGDFRSRDIEIAPDEIFVSDGAKSDCGNIGDIFGGNVKVAVTDPVYPVYVDTNVMAGRAGTLESAGTWSNLVYMPCVEENDFVPELPRGSAPDVIYLCYPNNPTGTTLTRDQLATWVDFALKNKSLILFDAAYEKFITEPDVPHSIYEIDGAKSCAIEFRSFSKTAGFTGLRCGYTVVPKELLVEVGGEKIPLNRLWNRRQTTKFNGVSYIVQRAAEAVFTDAGQAEIKKNIALYLGNAKAIRDALLAQGFKVRGGVNSPYVWVKTPAGTTSWQFFDRLLNDLAIVGTPGSGFGPSGEGYFRLTGFGSPSATLEACERLKNL